MHHALSTSPLTWHLGCRSNDLPGQAVEVLSSCLVGHAHHALCTKHLRSDMTSFMQELGPHGVAHPL